MDVGYLVSFVIYAIFIFMTIIYFWLFRHDQRLVHLYLSLIPTFICIYLLINHTHAQSAEGALGLGLLLLLTLISSLLYWTLYVLKKNK
ncbi:hypothetical protein [Enterococcus hermanniensis]|uniref:hypothetical protein n=1 Tax=Enterococcus hermanniensis TaxID=249189 RepID=UPI0009001AB7|nr:hypothetical protein [Enterococcus hermanniensis]